MDILNFDLAQRTFNTATWSSNLSFASCAIPFSCIFLLNRCLSNPLTFFSARNRSVLYCASFSSRLSSYLFRLTIVECFARGVGATFCVWRGGRKSRDVEKKFRRGLKWRYLGTSEGGVVVGWQIPIDLNC